MRNMCVFGLVAVLCGCESNFASQRDEFVAIADEIGDLDNVFNPAFLPTAGSATYEGVIVVQPPVTNIDLLGDIELDFDFRDSAFTGLADNFNDDENVSFDGELEITDGAIFRDANTAVAATFAGDIDGTLTDADGNDFDFDAILIGDFFSDDAEHAAGVIRGNVESDLGDFAVNDTNAAFVTKVE